MIDVKDISRQSFRKTGGITVSFGHWFSDRLLLSFCFARCQDNTGAARFSSGRRKEFTAGWMTTAISKTANRGSCDSQQSRDVSIYSKWCFVVTDRMDNSSSLRVAEALPTSG
jgi:hypothetical protein